jgi:hypothetical protein
MIPLYLVVMLLAILQVSFLSISAEFLLVQCSDQFLRYFLVGPHLKYCYLEWLIDYSVALRDEDKQSFPAKLSSDTPSLEFWKHLPFCFAMQTETVLYNNVADCKTLEGD